jgi:hypothetical protein
MKIEEEKELLELIKYLKNVKISNYFKFANVRIYF